MGIAMEEFRDGGKAKPYNSPILKEFSSYAQAGNAHDLKKAKPSNRVYVAGSVKNMQRVRDIMEAIEYAGGCVAYNWTRENQDSLLKDFSYRKEVIKTQLQEVKKADIFVLVTPGGRGSYVELGVALANKIKCYILLDPDNDNAELEVLVHSSKEVNLSYNITNLLNDIENDINQPTNVKLNDEDIPF